MINDNTLTHIKLSNISPERYFKVLIVADELLLQELIDYLLTYFIENRLEWTEQHFEFIHRISFQSNNLSEIQKFCMDFMAKSSGKIFKSLDFTSLPEENIDFIDEVWDVKMGFAQNQTLIPKPDTCQTLIRFYSLSSKEFLHKVRPYKKLLKQQLYENFLNSYMDPDIVPNDNNISLLRNIKIDRIIGTEIINLNIISIISRWIDKVNLNNKFSYLKELYLPFMINA
ncbi:uncharacterized protein OCT59_004610 [Rhizophagus irregularis]|uniref:Uncharacterized protein n=2 Tax=Rhizophagus irregularis TaxID=588596 RepID=A0A015LCH4_RHIIW|nr:hypothetical protein RirG_089470 [Rhizophagus irregularis DAOM 197198w]UZO13104.1 hypothetical protein OCT59_004610 [Rhizophagus irregularis]GBC54508.1 BTB/POZ protein [Rhizophagus irregularis DAOM 181602=DAOM 197198]